MEETSAWKNRFDIVWPLVHQNSSHRKSINVAFLTNEHVIYGCSYYGNLNKKLGLDSSSKYLHENEWNKERLAMLGLARFSKVNSVQEACAKYFAVHILKFEILQTTWKNKKTKQKTSK